MGGWGLGGIDVHAGNYLIYEEQVSERNNRVYKTNASSLRTPRRSFRNKVSEACVSSICAGVSEPNAIVSEPKASFRT